MILAGEARSTPRKTCLSVTLFIVNILLSWRIFLFNRLRSKISVANLTVPLSPII